MVLKKIELGVKSGQSISELENAIDVISSHLEEIYNDIQKTDLQ